MNLNLATWQEFQLDHLFTIKKGKRLTSEEQEDGSNNYIGALIPIMVLPIILLNLLFTQQIQFLSVTMVLLEKHFINPNLIGQPMM